MSCYLCGASSHLRECPRYNQSAALDPNLEANIRNQLKSPAQPVQPPIVTFQANGKTWRIDVVKVGGVIPDWATHSWFLDDRGGIGNSKSTLIELAKAWANEIENCYEKTPGMVMAWRRHKPGDIYDGGHDMLAVFCFWT